MAIIAKMCPKVRECDSCLLVYKGHEKEGLNPTVFVSKIRPSVEKKAQRTKSAFQCYRCS